MYSLAKVATVLAALSVNVLGQSPSQNHGSGASNTSPLSSSSSSKVYSSEYGVIEFDNFGFEGYYRHVKEIDEDKCTCELASNSQRTLFSGANSPIDEEVSVHFRGPLILNQFAYYVSDEFQYSSPGSNEFKRLAYYDGSSQTAENVTYLVHTANTDNCIGKALTTNGTDILPENTLISSDEEFVFFSNISCESSGFNNDCGVYRKGIPAYHGYYGTTKMFLFEFSMPEETSTDEDAFDYYNLPAIWLLNAHIPRTAQYTGNANCSCWATGCGEFDIFEAMNVTEADHLYSTLHDYQGSGDIGTGLQAQGYIQRDTDNVMKGGVVFGSDGSARVFMNSDLDIASTISATQVVSWISDEAEANKIVTDTLASATNTGTGAIKKSGSAPSFEINIPLVIMGVLGLTAFAVV